MAEISRATLFGKLNPLMFKSAEGAVTFCKLRGNPHVDLSHWLFQIVNLPDSDMHRILRHFEVDTARLVRDFQTTLERLPRGASAIEDFLKREKRKVGRFAEEQGAVEVYFPRVEIGGVLIDPFFNINEPEELAKAEMLLKEQAR